MASCTAYPIPVFTSSDDPWRKRLVVLLPPLGSRVCVSVNPCGIHGGRNGGWVDFLGISPLITYQEFHSTISPHSSHSCRFISFHLSLEMVRQAFSAVILAIHTHSNTGTSSHLIPRSLGRFSRGFSCFNLPGITYSTISQHLSHSCSFISFHLSLRWCVMLSRLSFSLFTPSNTGTSSHLIPR